MCSHFFFKIIYLLNIPIAASPPPPPLPVLLPLTCALPAGVSILLLSLGNDRGSRIYAMEAGLEALILVKLRASRSRVSHSLSLKPLVKERFTPHTTSVG